MAWRRNERSRTAQFLSLCREHATCVRAPALVASCWLQPCVWSVASSLLQGLQPLPALRGGRAGCAMPGVACATGADAARSRCGCVRFSDAGRSGVRSGPASQILRGRGSGEAAVEKLDSRGDPGDSSGCQNLAPRRSLLRPPRFCEAGEFPVIPGESHSIEHVHVH